MVLFQHVNVINYQINQYEYIRNVIFICQLKITPTICTNVSRNVIFLTMVMMIDN